MCSLMCNIYIYVLKWLLLLNGRAKSKSLNTMACPSQEGKTHIGWEGASQSARPTGPCTQTKLQEALQEACMRLVVGKLRKDPLNGPEARRFVSKSNGLLLQNASVGKSDLYKQLPSPAIHSCRRCGAMAFAWAIKIAYASSMQVNLAIRRRSRRTSWESLYVHEVYIGIFCNYSNDQPCQIKSGVSLSNHIDIVLATSYVISHTLGNML